MPVQDKPTLKEYFETGDVPTELQYIDLIDTMVTSAEISGNATRLVSGGIVWISGLTYRTVNLVFEVNGAQFSSNGFDVVLSAADATNPRIDVIYGDDTGAILVKEGTPLPVPVKPELEESYQLELTFAIISALATQPDDVGITDVYLEDVGQPTEYDITENTGGVRIDVADASTPISGAVSIKTIADLNTGDEVTAVHATAVQVVDFTYLKQSIKSLRDWGNDHIEVRLLSGVTQIASTLINKNNIDVSDLVTVQDLTLFKSSFGTFTGTEFDSIVFWHKSTNKILYVLDDISIQTGVVVTPPITVKTPIENLPYADLSALVADQVNQSNLYIQEVTDASGFTTVTSGRAWVRYKGTTVGDETDYIIVSSSENGTDYAEWAQYTGTRIGADLTVLLGDYDGSAEGTMIKIDDAARTISIGDVTSVNDGTFLKIDDSNGSFDFNADINLLTGKTFTLGVSQITESSGILNINNDGLIIIGRGGGFLSTSNITLNAAIGVLVSTVLTSYTLTGAAINNTVTLSNAAATALTIPTNASLAFPINSKITLINLGVGVVTVGGAGVTINQNIGGLTMAQNDKRTLIKVDTDTWLLSGSGGGDALTTNPLSQFAATTSAQLAGVLSDETGSGLAVFATDPTITSPIINTSISGSAILDEDDFASDSDTQVATQQSTKAYVDAVEASISLLQTSSTITVSRDGLLTDADGLNISTASADVTITVPLNAVVAYPIGTILQYKREGTGNVIMAYDGTGEAAQTYYDNQVITIRKTATDIWGVLNPPQPKLETIEIPTSDLTTALTVGFSLGFHRMTFSMQITDVRLVLLDAGTVTGMTVDINKNGGTILSTKLTTDATESTSTTATTPYVLSSSTLADGDILLVDHDVVPTVGLGAAIQIIGYRL
jgi:hypothetical protein